MSVGKLQKFSENLAWVNKSGFVVFQSINFVYVTTVNLYAKRYFSQVNKTYYESKTEIKNIVDSLWKNKHTEICTELYGAPKEYLMENDFRLYEVIPKIKKTKSEQKNNVTKS